MEISKTNTKNEIWEAYQVVLAQLKEDKQMSFQSAKKQRDEEEVVTKATGFNVEQIVNNIAQVKVSLDQALDAIEQRLIGEYKRLGELQEAIRVETKQVEDVYQISKNADTLSALLLANKESRQKLEQEYAQRQQELKEDIVAKKSAWQKEQEEFEIANKERDAKLKKDRMRDEEEYRYNVAQERKKDQDMYLARKEALEKQLIVQKDAVERELAERETVIAAREKEYEQLKEKTVQLELALQKTAQETEEKTRKAVELHYKHQTELEFREVDGERKLNQQTIASLQEKIKKQDELIKQLTQRVDDAQDQVRAMAIKALEGASGLRQYVFDEAKKGQEATR
jgi:hypothetical protein